MLVYRAYKTPYDIIHNKLFTVTKEQAQEIQNLVKDGKNSRLKGNEDVVKGSTVEVLEHWGDLKLPNGRLLKNWHAVVVARKYLVFIDFLFEDISEKGLTAKEFANEGEYSSDSFFYTMINSESVIVYSDETCTKEIRKYKAIETKTIE